uniref:Uncharacterized protein n=1 Tax=Magallana gigas TaxID=29159 RepID=A0A8W8MQQ1_MAGGI
MSDVYPYLSMPNTDGGTLDSKLVKNFNRRTEVSCNEEGDENKVLTNISKHYQQVHKNEPQVREIMDFSGIKKENRFFGIFYVTVGTTITTNRMREAARLLLNARDLDSNLSMSDLLRSENFDNVAKGALITASPGFDDEEDLKAPLTAIRLGYEIKRMLSAKWAEGIKSKDEAAANDSKSFLKLMKFEWSTKVTKLATVTLQVRSFNKEKSLPEPEDIIKIQEKIRNDIKTFDEKDTTPQNFRFAAEVSQARLLLYNKRRSGEIEGIRSMRAELTVLEQKLLESQDLIEVRGKLGRGVPAGIQPSNDFLFSNTRFGVLRAYDSLKAFCDKCYLKKPEKITSVNLRKYTATIAQVFDISPQQQQWLTNHLGHTLDIHKIHYRQTSGIIERVDISKLMLLTEYGLTGKYPGKKLTDITLEEISAEIMSGPSEPLDEGTSAVNIEKNTLEEDVPPELHNLVEEADLQEEEEEETSLRRKKSSSSTRIKWTKAELEEGFRKLMTKQRREAILPAAEYRTVSEKNQDARS